jgi:hypothetical protein
MTRLPMSQARVSIERARAEHWPEIRELLLSRGLLLDGAKEHLGHFLVASTPERWLQHPDSTCMGVSAFFARRRSGAARRSGIGKPACEAVSCAGEPNRVRAHDLRREQSSE